MKITFNDGQELQIQQITEQTDGALLIKTISASEDQLKTLFSDSTTTKRMSVSERDEDTVVYENYTKLDAIVKYTAGILGVLMYREGEDPDSRIAALEARLKEAEEKNTNRSQESKKRRRKMKCSKDAFWKCLKRYISKTIIVLTILFILLQISGGKEMMAMLWAQQIMLGKKTYSQVPRLLKDKVKEILIDSGVGELVTEE